MIGYKKAEGQDLNKIMEVISDVDLKSQEESKNKIVNRILEDRLLCCLSVDNIIGFLGWDTKFQNNLEHWYLEQITIQKDYRGKGIGSDFVKHFLQICRDKKVKKLYAHVQGHNSQSFKMFSDIGWIVNTDLDKSVPNEITLEFIFE